MPVSQEWQLPELFVVSNEYDLLWIEVDDWNEALRLHAHPALVDDQLVQRHAPVFITCMDQR